MELNELEEKISSTAANPTHKKRPHNSACRKQASHAVSEALAYKTIFCVPCLPRAPIVANAGYRAVRLKPSHEGPVGDGEYGRVDRVLCDVPDFEAG
jgi:hypothetical protein